jgi:hypothetical protein
VLDSLGVSDLAARIAAEFVDTLGATRKFVDFLTAYLPPAPSKGPEEWRRIQWETTEMQQAFRIIYGHRSRALHAGIPFPPPMCDAVQYVGRSDVPAERPSFIAAHQEGGTWLLKDVPMHLHMFPHSTGVMRALTLPLAASPRNIGGASGCADKLTHTEGNAADADRV